DERRGFADHLLELVVRNLARFVRIEHDVHGAAGVELRLLHDPAAERCRFFPVHVAERIAAYVVAERVHVGAVTDAIRGAQLAFDRRETSARSVAFEEAREDDYFAADAHAALLEKESERVARVEIDLTQFDAAAVREEKLHVY